MTFISATSPHTRKSGTTWVVMRDVALALLPGAAAMTYLFGWGVLTNVVITVAACLLFEAGFLRLRGRPIGFYLRDGSALVTALLLGLSVPPYAPWWLLIIGSFFAIVIAKQLYGGLGFNPFNPAMVAYVVLLISFPVTMSLWAAPSVLPGQSLPGLGETLAAVFGSGAQAIDGLTAATPLDIVKQNDGELMQTLYAETPLFAEGRWAAAGFEWVNIAFLIGGGYLLWRKVFTWHAPVMMLLTLVVLSALFYDGGSSTSPGSPALHVLSGATMLGAFFIITDPVSSAVSNKGRLIYGASIGMLVFAIRGWGNYPDAVAFAVLLMNFAAPFIDYYTVPRTYGHSSAKKATAKSDKPL